MLLSLGVGSMPAQADWTTYHFDNHRSADLSADTGLPDQPVGAWNRAVDGLVYAEPLVYGNQVLVATENNTIYSLDLHDGHVNWSRSVMTTGRHPVPQSQLPCGNIDPTGVTGTPVIDPTSGKLFVVAESWDGTNQSSDHHHLWALDLNNLGNPTVTAANADPVSVDFDPRSQQHRAALALNNGKVYFTYGGRSGDCEPYHGWVGRIDEDGTGFLSVNVNAGAARGGIWATSGPSIDDSGNLYVATGNGNQANSSAPSDLTDSVVKLSPTLAILDHFTPTNWGDENAADIDLGSAGPLLLGNSLVYQVGKSGTSYLLNTSSLGGGNDTGGAAWSGPVCHGFGGSAYEASRDVIYSTCTDGVRALQVHRVGSGVCPGGAEPCLQELWQGPNNASGPPILLGHNVWTRASTFGGTSVNLYGIDHVSGRTIATIGGLDGAAHFVTPAASSGFLLMASGSSIRAWAACGIGPPGPPGYNILTAGGGIYSFGTALYYGNLIDHHYPGPAAGLAETPGGHGYNILTDSGAIYSFGDAQYFGNLLDHGYPGPAVSLAFTPTGSGYSILTRSGGLYTFGAAPYFGNLIDHHYPGQAAGLAYTPSGGGYWILTREGAIDSFGDAQYYGNLIDHHYPGPAASLAASSAGYGILTTGGGLYTFGNHPYLGNLLDHCYPGPATALSNTP